MSEVGRQGGLFAGRFTREAGVGILLEALDLFPGARVTAIGAGPEEERLRAHPQVCVLGALDPFSVQAYMAVSAYLVLPSLMDEDEPRPVIEAFSNALPVLASRLDGLAQMIQPGRNGLLFEPGSARDLARRLAWAEAFGEKMRQMGACARADYEARFIGDWSYPKLFGERRRSARL